MARSAWMTRSKRYSVISIVLFQRAAMCMETECSAGRNAYVEHVPGLPDVEFAQYLGELIAIGLGDDHFARQIILLCGQPDLGAAFALFRLAVQIQGVEFAGRRFDRFPARDGIVV